MHRAFGYLVQFVGCTYEKEWRWQQKHQLRWPECKNAFFAYIIFTRCRADWRLSSARTCSNLSWCWLPWWPSSPRVWWREGASSECGRWQSTPAGWSGPTGTPRPSSGTPRWASFSASSSCGEPFSPLTKHKCRDTAPQSHSGMQDGNSTIYKNKLIIDDLYYLTSVILTLHDWKKNSYADLQIMIPIVLFDKVISWFLFMSLFCDATYT